eukprot:gene17092-10692_t
MGAVAAGRRPRSLTSSYPHAPAHASPYSYLYAARPSYYGSAVLYGKAC